MTQSGNLDKAQNDIFGITVSIKILDFGPLLGLSDPKVPSLNGPSSEDETTSLSHDFQFDTSEYIPKIFSGDAFIFIVWLWFSINFCRTLFLHTKIFFVSQGNKKAESRLVVAFFPWMSFSGVFSIKFKRPMAPVARRFAPSRPS